MRVLLVYPPQQTFYGPHLGIPSLTAHLRSAGVDTIQRDLNVELNRALLTPDWLRRAARRGGERFAAGGRPEPVLWAEAHVERVCEELPAALAALSSWEVLQDDARLTRAFGVLSDAYAVLSAGWYPTEISYGLSMQHPLSTWAGLQAAVADAACNPFREALQPLLGSLLADEPDLVGVGITYEEQLVGALTLADLLRQARPELPLVLGGALVARLGPALLERGELPGPFDFAVLHEGETALLALAEALAAGRAPPDTTPNLLRPLPSGGLHAGPPGVERVDDLATPDFVGLPLNDYLLPEPVLPLLTSRGCYWGRCAFCAHHLAYGDGGRFRNRSPERIESDLVALSERHASRTLYLVDEAVPPRNLREVSRVNRQRDLGLSWFGDVRLDAALTPELLRDMAAGGCRLLIYGLESGAQPSLERMRKGIDAARSKLILEAAHDAGIANVVMVFVGFPGETVAEAQQTARWLDEAAGWLESVGIGSFSLLRGAPAWANPAEYGITWVAESPERGELGHTYGYGLRRGIDGSSASRIAEALRRRQASRGSTGTTFPREVIALRRALSAGRGPTAGRGAVQSDEEDA